MNLRKWIRKLIKWRVYKAQKRMERYIEYERKLIKLKDDAENELWYWQQKLKEV